MNKNFDKILEILENNKYKSVSGEKIADELGITRAAVSKVVKNLRKVGYRIDARNKVGYKFSDDNYLINKTQIENALGDVPCNLTFLYDVDSTNKYARHLKSDETELVVSLCQRGGRGRRGREFASPIGDGIYFSLLLHPDLSATQSLLLTTSAALAVSRAIDKNANTMTGIKWVNDVFIGSKKCAGILSEARFDVENSKLDYVVVGIGINIYTPDDGFDESISDIATSVSKKPKTSELSAAILADTVKEFLSICENITDKKYLEEYRSKCNCIGKTLSVIKSTGHRRAYCVGVADDYSLTVEYEDGTVENLNSGEVSLKILD